MDQYRTGKQEMNYMSDKSSFVFFENTYVHAGQRRLYADWDFVTRMAQNSGAPVNWEEPVNYCDGTYDFEVDVLEMGKVDKPVIIQFGWWNTENDPEIRHIASRQLFFDKPGSYKLTYKLKDTKCFYGKGPKADERCYLWYWDKAYANNTIYTLINPNGNSSEADGFPYKVHVKVTVHEE